MAVKCMLCGEEYGAITATHLRFVHSVTLDNYQRMFPGVELWSKEVRQRISDGVNVPEVKQQISKGVSATLSRPNPHQSEIMLAVWNRPGYRMRISEAMTKVWGRLGYREAVSEALTGRTMSEEARRKISEARTGIVLSEETRLKISEALWERWKDPEFAQMMFKAMSKKPNESEHQLQLVLDKHFPDEWEYVGDGRLWVGSKNPDFINTDGKKQVIEMFGIYWHDPILFPNRPTEEELIAHYKQFGFDCLILWEYDIWDEMEVIKRIKALGE